MWDLPGPGLKPVSPAMAGGFLNTAPPGKSTILYLEWGLGYTDICIYQNTANVHLGPGYFMAYKSCIKKKEM